MKISRRRFNAIAGSMMVIGPISTLTPVVPPTTEGRMRFYAKNGALLANIPVLLKSQWGHRPRKLRGTGKGDVTCSGLCEYGTFHVKGLPPLVMTVVADGCTRPANDGTMRLDNNNLLIGGTVHIHDITIEMGYVSI
jgi:hypothetical protein